jgi:hypothetical protein
VASRPLAEVEVALSQAIARLQRLRIATPGLWGAVAAIFDAGWDRRVAAVRNLSGQARNLVEQATGRLPGERQQALIAALDAAAATLPAQPPELPDSPWTRAARVLGYLSGDPAAHLTAAEQGELARQLLIGQASPGERALALLLLAATDDTELGAIFADGEMLELLQARIGRRDPLRDLLDHFLDTRFEPGPGGTGLVVAAGRQPAQPFDPALIDERLHDLPVAGELTADQAALAAEVITGLTGDALRIALAPLPHVQRVRAAWWLARVRAWAGWARAVTYLSGAREGRLSPEERQDLVVRLLEGGLAASPDERWLALVLLRTAEDGDLTAMLAGGALLDLLGSTILPGDPLSEALDDMWRERFKFGWTGAATGDRARGVPAREFELALIGRALEGVNVSAELTEDLVTQAVQAIRGEDDLAAALSGLPPMEQVRAEQWLVRLRAAVDAQAPDGSPEILARLDDLREGLQAGIARRGLDTARLLDISAHPPRRQAPALRGVRGPVRAAEVAAAVARLNQLPAAERDGVRVSVLANTAAEEIERLLAAPGTGAAAVPGAVSGTAELDIVRRALAGVTDAEAAIGNVLTELNSVVGAQLTTAGVRARAARVLLPHTGAAQDALSAGLETAEQGVSSLPELPQRPLAISEAIEAARQRLTRVRALEEATRHVLTGATAPLGGIRPQMEAAERLARAAQVLVPHTGAEQARLSEALTSAMTRLRQITPTWWTANGTPLATMTQVEAAVPALTAGTAGLENAARDLELRVRDVLTAVAPGWAQTAAGLRAAASALGDLLPHVGERQPDLAAALQEALQRVDAAPQATRMPPPAGQRSMADMEMDIAAMAPVTDLEAAIRRVTAAASHAARQEADVLIGLPDQMRSLRLAAQQPDGLGSDLTAAERAVTEMISRPAEPDTTTAAIEAARHAVTSVAGLRDSINAVLAEASEGLADRIATATALFSGMGEELPLSGEQREDLVALDQGIPSLVDAGEASRDIASSVAVVRRGTIALTDLETAASQYLDPLALSRRATAVMDQARAAPELLAAVTGQHAGPAGPLEPGIAAVRTALGHVPSNRPATPDGARFFGEQIRALVAAVTALENATRQHLAAATAGLDGLRPDVEAAEILAEAAQGLLRWTGGHRAGLAGRLNQAAMALRAARPGWWQAAGAELMTAAEVTAAAQGLAGAPERVRQASQGLRETVAAVLHAAHDITRVRAGEITELGQIMAEDLLPHAGEQQLALAAALDDVLARADGIQRMRPPEATIAGVDAVGRAVDRLDAIEADIGQIFRQATTDLEQRIDAAADLARVALELTVHAGGQRAALARAVTEAKQAMPAQAAPPPEGTAGPGVLAARPPVVSGTADPRVLNADRMQNAARQLRDVTRLEAASRDVLTAVTGELASRRPRVDAARARGLAARTLLGYTRKPQEKLADRLNDAIGRLHKNEPAWLPAPGTGPVTVADLEAARQVLVGPAIEAVVQSLEQTAAEVLATAEARWREHRDRALDREDHARQLLPILGEQEVGMLSAMRELTHAQRALTPAQLAFTRAQLALAVTPTPGPDADAEVIAAAGTAMNDLLGLATQVFDDRAPGPGPEDVIDLRRLTDIIWTAPAGDGGVGGRDVSLAGLVAEFRRRADLAGADAVAMRDLRELAQRVRHAAVTELIAVAGTALHNLVDATERLDAAIRATALGRVDALLGRGHGLDLAQATAVMELADRLLRTAPPAETDVERFDWLAGQAGLRNRENARLPNYGTRDQRPVTRPLVSLLRLVTQVFDDSAPRPAALDDVIDLRRLTDIIRIAPEGEGGVRGRDVELADLEAQFRHLNNLADADAVTTQDLRELARQVRQAKAAKSRYSRQVSRDDMSAMVTTYTRVRQAQLYLDAMPGADLAYFRRRQLIWNLLTGLVTDDALRAVLGLLNASNDDELEDLYRGGQLERRLESAIPAGHPLRTELNQLYQERFTARQVTRRLRVVTEQIPLRTRTFRPGMISPVLAGVAADGDLTPSSSRAHSPRSATGPSRRSCAGWACPPVNCWPGRTGCAACGRPPPGGTGSSATSAATRVST